MNGRRSLRSRLTLLVAAAVALAIAVCAVLCWFVVRAELLRQVERSLGVQKGPQGIEWIEAYCSGGLKGPRELIDERRPPLRLPPTQLIYADGGRCVVGATPVRVTPADLALTHALPGTRAYRNGVTEGGEEVRVMTRNVGSASRSWSPGRWRRSTPPSPPSPGYSPGSLRSAYSARPRPGCWSPAPHCARSAG